MKAKSMTFVFCALLLAGACSDRNETATTAPAGSPAVEQQQQQTAQQLTPEQLGELGAQINKNPGDAQRLLTERGLNATTFEQAVRKVSEDPAASKRYADSYKKAGA